MEAMVASILSVPTVKNNRLNSRTLLLMVVIVVLTLALPTWPYSRGWGYYPIGGLGLVLLIAIILIVMGWF